MSFTEVWGLIVGNPVCCSRYASFKEVMGLIFGNPNGCSEVWRLRASLRFGD
jgi:hypothetical protein